MFKIILLGWICGIALMGIHLPLIMQYGEVAKVLLLLAFIFYLFRRSVFVGRPLLKAIYCLLCTTSLFIVGYQYAENALIERLQQRETDSKNVDIIVYIKKLSEEKNNKVQQTAQVLNLSSVHDKFHRTLILSGFCFLKIAKISLNSSFFPKPIKR